MADEKNKNIEELSSMLKDFRKSHYSKHKLEKIDDIINHLDTFYPELKADIDALRKEFYELKEDFGDSFTEGLDVLSSRVTEIEDSDVTNEVESIVGKVKTLEEKVAKDTSHISKLLSDNIASAEETLTKEIARVESRFSDTTYVDNKISGVEKKIPIIPDLKGKVIVEKINELPIEPEFQIDASHIKNLLKPEIKHIGGGISRGVVESLIAAIPATANTWTAQQTFSVAPIFSTMTEGSVLFAGPGGLISQDNANFFWDNGNNWLGINSTNIFAPLTVGSGDTYVNTVANFSGTSDSYLQINFQNQSAGNFASSDVVASADDSTDALNYIDMGINSSTFNDSNFTLYGGAHGSYIITESPQFTIATVRSGANIVFGIGGSLAANEVARFTSTGNLGINVVAPTARIEIEAADDQLTVIKATNNYTGAPGTVRLMEFDAAVVPTAGQAATLIGLDFNLSQNYQPLALGVASNITGQDVSVTDLSPYNLNGTVDNNFVTFKSTIADGVRSLSQNSTGVFNANYVGFDANGGLTTNSTHTATGSSGINNYNVYGFRANITNTMTVNSATPLTRKFTFGADITAANTTSGSISRAFAYFVRGVSGATDNWAYFNNTTVNNFMGLDNSQTRWGQGTGALNAAQLGVGTRGDVFIAYSGTVWDFDVLLATTEIVFNNSSFDTDFRIESNNQTHMFFIDAGNDAIGIKNSSPAAYLHLGAGTATAGTGPLRFTSGTVLTAAVAGTVEFTTDDLFFTITTGAARKAVILDDGTRLTSGRVPFATTNGRLIDDADFTFATDTLTVTKIAATTFTGNLTISTKDIVTDTSTGTKFATGATQKIGFWGTAPIVQPATGGAASTFVANTSAIVDDSATFDGYTIGQVIKALRNAGLLA